MQSSQRKTPIDKITDISEKEEDKIINKLIIKYENEVKKLKSYKLTYTTIDNFSRGLVFFLLLSWIALTLFLDLQRSNIGVIIIILGIIYSIIVLFKPLVIQPCNNNFSFLLIGLPLYIWLDRRYAGDVEYIATVLFSTGLYASFSMIEYPLNYERSGLIRNIASVYTVLLFLYVLYDISININPLTNTLNQLGDDEIPPII